MKKAANSLWRNYYLISAPTLKVYLRQWQDIVKLFFFMTRHYMNSFLTNKLPKKNLLPRWEFLSTRSVRKFQNWKSLTRCWDTADAVWESPILKSQRCRHVQSSKLQ